MPRFICLICLYKQRWRTHIEINAAFCQSKERIHYLISELYLPVLISVPLQHLTVSIFYTTHDPAAQWS